MPWRGVRQGDSSGDDRSAAEHSSKRESTVTSRRGRPSSHFGDDISDEKSSPTTTGRLGAAGTSANTVTRSPSAPTESSPLLIGKTARGGGPRGAGDSEDFVGNGMRHRGHSGSSSTSATVAVASSVHTTLLSSFYRSCRLQSWLTLLLAGCFHLFHVLLILSFLLSPLLVRSVAFSASTMERPLLAAQRGVSPDNQAALHPSVSPGKLAVNYRVESIWSIHDAIFFLEPGHRLVPASIKESFTALYDGGRRGPATSDESSEEAMLALPPARNTTDAHRHAYVVPRHERGSSVTPPVAFLVSPAPMPHQLHTSNHGRSIKKTTLATVAAAWEASPLYSSPLALTLFYYLYLVGSFILLFTVTGGWLNGCFSVLRLLVGVCECTWYIHHGGHSFLLHVWFVLLSHWRGPHTAGEAVFLSGGTPYALVARDGTASLHWYVTVSHGNTTAAAKGALYREAPMNMQRFIYDVVPLFSRIAAVVTTVFLALVIACLMRDTRRVVEAIVGVRALTEPEGCHQCPLCKEIIERRLRVSSTRRRRRTSANAGRSARTSAWNYLTGRDGGLRHSYCGGAVMALDSSMDEVPRAEVFYAPAEQRSGTLRHAALENGAALSAASLQSARGAAGVHGAEDDEDEEDVDATTDTTEEDVNEGGIVKVLVAPSAPARATHQGRSPQPKMARASRASNGGSARSLSSSLYRQQELEQLARGHKVNPNAQLSYLQHTTRHVLHQCPKLLLNQSLSDEDSSGGSSEPSVVDEYDDSSNSSSSSASATNANARTHKRDGSIPVRGRSSSPRRRLPREEPTAADISLYAEDAAHTKSTVAVDYGTMNAFLSVDRIVNRAVYDPFNDSEDEFRPGNAFPSYEQAGVLSRLTYSWLSPLISFAQLEPTLLRNENFLPTLPERLTSLKYTDVPVWQLWLNRKTWFRSSIAKPGDFIPTDDALSAAEELYHAISAPDVGDAEESEEDEETASSENQTMVIVMNKPLKNAKFRAHRPRHSWQEDALVYITRPLWAALSHVFYRFYIGRSHTIERTHSRLLKTLVQDRLATQREHAEGASLLQDSTPSSAGSDMPTHMRRQLSLSDVSVFTLFLQHRCGRVFLYQAAPLLLLYDVLLLSIVPILTRLLTLEGAMRVAASGAVSPKGEISAPVDQTDALQCCLLLVAVLVAQVMVYQLYWSRVGAAAAEAKVAIRTLVLEKTMVLPLAQRTFSDEEVTDLVVVQAVRCASALLTLHFAWSNPFMLIAVVGLVLYYLGMAPALVVVVGVIFFVPIMRRDVALVRRCQRQLPSTTARTTLLASALTNIRLVKAVLLERAVAGHVRRDYATENAGARDEARLEARAATTAAASALFFVVSCFTAHYWAGGSLTTSTLLPVLASLMLLWSPLQEFPPLFSSIAHGYLSMKRVEAYLRQTPDEFMGTWVDLMTCEGKAAQQTRGAIFCHNCSFTWQHDLAEEVAQPALVDVHLSIQPGELVVIQGPVGAGKSTLLLTILGEVNRCVDIGPRGGGGVDAVVGRPSAQDDGTSEGRPVRASERSEGDTSYRSSRGACVHLASAPHVPGMPKRLPSRPSLVNLAEQMPLSSFLPLHKSTASPPTYERDARSSGVLGTSSGAAPSAAQLPSSEGFLVFGSCVYCSEVPWLQNNTIRANITAGGNPSHARWYQQVIRACALEEDLAKLPLGDRTVVGDCGIPLGASMKSRIALARAVFTRSDIYLLDSVLTTVDGPTRLHIITEVFHKLLRNKTVLISTNVGLATLQPHRIFTVTEDGAVREDTDLYKTVDSSDSSASSARSSRTSSHANTGADDENALAGSHHRASVDDGGQHGGMSSTPPRHPALFAEEYCEATVRESPMLSTSRAAGEANAFSASISTTSADSSDGFLFNSPTESSNNSSSDDVLNASARTRTPLHPDRAAFLREEGSDAVFGSLAAAGSRLSYSFSSQEVFRHQSTRGDNGQAADGASSPRDDAITPSKRGQRASASQAYTITDFMRTQAVWLLLSSMVQQVLFLSPEVWLAVWLTYLAPLRVPLFLMLLAVLGLAATGLVPLRWFLRFRILHRGIRRIYLCAVDSTLRAPVAFVDRHTPLAIAAILDKDLAIARSGIPKSVDIVLGAVMQLLVVAVFNVYLNPWFFVVVPLGASLLVDTMSQYRVASREVRRLENRSVRATVAILEEALRGAPIIRCLALQDRIREEYCRTIDFTSTATLVAATADSWVGLRVHLVTVVAAATAALLGVLFAHTGAAPGLTGIAVITCWRTTRVVSLLCRRSGMLQKEWLSMRRMMRLCHAPVEPMVPREDASSLQLSLTTPATPEERHTPAGTGEGTTPPVFSSSLQRGLTSPTAEIGSPACPPLRLPPPLCGGARDDDGVPRSRNAGDSTAATPAVLPVLHLHNTSVRYRRTLPFVLHHINLAVYPRERVAVVGPRGSGKGTLLNTLLRLVGVVEGGGIYINGVAVRHVPYVTLRSWFGVVPQQPLLLPGTWRSNLLAGSPIQCASAHAGCAGDAAQSGAAGEEKEAVQLSVSRHTHDTAAHCATKRQQADERGVGSPPPANSLQHTAVWVRESTTDPRVSAPAAEEDAALWQALRAVGLDYVAEFDGGLNAQMLGGELNDVGLSPQQRQLFYLARAVLRQPPLVLMEELASGASRDAKYGAVLKRVLTHELRNSTVLLIAHYASTAVNLCSRAVVLKGGSVHAVMSLSPAASAGTPTAVPDSGERDVSATSVSQLAPFVE